MTGSEIKDRRLCKYLTQQELADLCGVSRITVWNWENGNTKPSLKELKNLKKALGIEE